MNVFISLFYRALLAVLIAATCFAHVAHADEAKEYRIPVMVEDKTKGLPLIKVRINDSKPYFFLVDTGCDPAIILTKWVTDELKLSARRKPESDTVKDRPTYSLNLAKIFFVPEGKSEPYIARNRVAVCVDFDLDKAAGTNPRLAGVIGAGFLTNITACFDFSAKTLRLRAAPHKPLTLPNATVVPLNTMTGLAGFDTALQGVNISLPGVENIAMLLDTGSSSVHLRPDIALKIASLRLSRDQTATADVLGTEKRSVELLLPFLKIAGRTENDVEVLTSKTGEVNILGMSFLRLFRVTLDIRNKQMILENATDYQDFVTQTGYSGLTAGLIGRNMSVYGLDARVELYKAGVLLKDNILSVDGIAVQGKDKAQVQRLINGKVGTVLRLRLKRASGTEYQVKATRTNRFLSPDEKMNLGVGLRVEENKDVVKVRVVNVLPNSPAFAANLMVDDEITSVNGINLSGLSTTDASKILFEQPRDAIVFNVRRGDQTIRLEIRAKTATLRDLLK